MILIISCLRGVCILLSTGWTRRRACFLTGGKMRKSPAWARIWRIADFGGGERRAQPVFFLRQQEKMTFGGWQNPKRDEKVSKTVKKSSKKILTEERDCDIIIKLSARAKRRADSDDPWKRYRIKKNANCDFHESQLRKDSQFENEFWTWER